jgi:hypothetical protein
MAHIWPTLPPREERHLGLTDLPADVPSTPIQSSRCINPHRQNGFAMRTSLHITALKMFNPGPTRMDLRLLVHTGTPMPLILV